MKDDRVVITYDGKRAVRDMLYVTALSPVLLLLINLAIIYS